MGPKDIYVIDTCSLIAMTEAYPKDVFPGVWRKVDILIDDKVIISSAEVLHELLFKDDDLHQWAKARSDMFKDLDDEIQKSVTEILRTHTKLIDSVNKKSSADPFVIATARVHYGVVVTEENLSGGQRPKIPNVCNDYNIPHVNLLEMLRLERLSL